MVDCGAQRASNRMAIRSDLFICITRISFTIITVFPAIHQHAGDIKEKKSC